MALSKLMRAALAVAATSAIALAPAASAAAPRRAKNVILFLGDAGGLPTLNAAGILAHDRPQSLFIHSMPHMALSDTSSLDRWVTDSGAGMTAIMTGHKTNNAMISVVPSTDGTTVTPVKTLLEMAEERGLSTGVITNQPIWDATPAVCYAHAAKRSSKDDIFRQLVTPRFGDGVDIVVGKGRKDAEASFARSGTTAEKAFTGAGYVFGEDPSVIARETARTAILRDADYAPIPAVEATISRLSHNRKGYFLMVEWDMHTDKPDAGLRHVTEMDDLIRRVSALAGPDTLILFVADHSFGLRLRDGSRATPLADQYTASVKSAASHATNPLVSVDDTHTGEEVVATASGPGSDQLHGFLPNTGLFHIMAKALGWATGAKPRE